MQNPQDQKILGEGNLSAKFIKEPRKSISEKHHDTHSYGSACLKTKTSPLRLASSFSDGDCLRVWPSSSASTRTAAAIVA
jgi:hypothetical protein